MTVTEKSLDSMVLYPTNGCLQLPEEQPKTKEFLEDLDVWLRDRTIGPLTGLAKRWADLDLIEEPYKLPKQFQLKAFSLMAASYYLRGESHMVHRMMEDPNTPLNEEVLMYLERAIVEPPATENHRLEILLSEYDELQKIKRNLGRDKRIVMRHRSRTELSKETPELIHKMHEQKERLLYNTLRQFLGIKIAEGHICGTKYYVKHLKHFPHRQKYEKHGHTKAVIDYLEHGGARTLRERAAFKFGTNKYFWRNWIGTRTHPGRLRKPAQQLLENMRAAPLKYVGDVVGTSVTLMAANAAYQNIVRPIIETYGPAVSSNLQAMGLFYK